MLTAAAYVDDVMTQRVVKASWLWRTGCQAVFRVWVFVHVLWHHMHGVPCPYLHAVLSLLLLPLRYSLICFGDDALALACIQALPPPFQGPESFST